MAERKLKPGWRWVRFGDVVRLVKDRCIDPKGNGVDRYVGLDHIDSDDLRIRRWGNVTDGITFTNVFRAGQVLFGKRRAYQRKVGLADFSGVCSGDIYVLESAKPTELLPALLPIICQTDRFFKHAVGTSAGSLSPRTNWTSLARFEFSLPPLNEQERIAEFGRGTNELLEGYRRLSEVLQQVASSGANDYFKSTNGSAMKKKALGSVADVHYGITLGPKRLAFKVRRPYLRVANVQRFQIDLTEVKEVGVDDGEDGELLRPKDVLVVEGHADISQLGRAAIWDGQVSNCLHQNHLLRVRCGKDLLPGFALAFLNSPVGQRYFRSRGKSTSGLNTINSTVLREMTVPVPSIEEQERVVQRFARIRAMMAETINRRSRLANAVNQLLAESMASQEDN